VDSSGRRGRVAIVGAGPAGMAAAISILQVGHEVTLFERHPQATPSGNILNLWPPPIRALQYMNVDLEDIGQACEITFRRGDGRPRATITMPEHITAEFGGPFLGLLRPTLYERLQAALPPGVIKVNSLVERFEQDERGVHLHLANGDVHDFDVLVGADGIDSLVRQELWGRSDRREHNLHILGGYTLEAVPNVPSDVSVVMHNRTTQGAWTPIRYQGSSGVEWWVLTSHTASAPFTGNLKDRAVSMAKGFVEPLPSIVAATKPEHVQRWQIADKPPLPQWAKGRVTIIGDAAHATSPYAAYGAGMAIEDGYYLGRKLAGLDLSDFTAVETALLEFEAPRIPHTKLHSQFAYYLGQLFHRIPGPLRVVRDLVYDYTPFMQKTTGNTIPRDLVEQLNELEQTEKRFRNDSGLREPA
jgi:2-polyprenyl-6-methoxyphenol hydroxylase-like FAD-dependent oxidoreductase